MTAEVNVTPNDCTLEYQWFASDDNVISDDDLAIDGATAAEYTIGSGMIGKYVYVRVTASKENYANIAISDMTDVENNGSVTIAKVSLDKPTANTLKYEYTGSEIELGISGFDAITMNISGNTGTEVGEYNAVVSLKDTANYEWADRSTRAISYEWEITHPTVGSMVSRGELAVGDYVAYNTDSATYKTDTAKTGYSTSQTLSTVDADWRILSIDEETGTVLLTTNGIVNDGIYLNGTAGRTSGLVELHNISATLYSNSSLGLTARSMTLEELYEAVEYTPPESDYKYAYYPIGTTGLSGTTDDGYTKVAHKAMDSAQGWTEPRFYVWDDENGNTITSTDKNIYKTPTSSAPVKVTQNAYLPHIGSLGTTNSATVSDILGTSYGWVASSVVGVGDDTAVFLSYFAGDNTTGCRTMQYSDGTLDDGTYPPYAEPYGLRPVVTLISNLKITGKDASGAWTIEK